MAAALKASTVAAKAQAVALKGVAIAGNMLLGIGVSMLISSVIKGIDNYIHRIDNAREAITEISSEIKEVNDTFNNTSKTVSDISRRFAQLSQGVNQITGANKTLNTEEYEEYLELNTQIAELLPSLPKIYNENGQAIVQLKGDVDTIVGSLQNLLDVERDLANQKLADKMPELYKNIKKSSKEYNESIDYLQEQKDRMVNVVSDFNAEMIKNALSEDVFKIYGTDAKQMAELSKLYNYAFESLGMSLTRNSDNEFTVSSFDKYRLFDLQSSDDIDKEIEKAFKYAVNKYGKEYNSSYDEIISKITTINNKKNSEYDKLKQSMFAWLSTDSGSGYSMMSDNLQAGIQTIIGSLDFDYLTKEYSEEEFQNYILDNIIYPIRDNGSVQKAINDLFTTDFSEKPLQDANAMIDTFIAEIAKALNKNPFELKVSLGFGNYGDVKNRLGEAIQSASDGDPFLKSMLLGFTQNMSYKEAEYFLSFFDEAQGAIDWINKYNEALKNAAEETSKFFSEAQIEKLDKYQSKIKELGDAYGKILSKNYSRSDILDILKTLSEQGVDISNVDSIEGLEALIKHSSTAKDEVEALIKELGIKPESDFADFLREMAYETARVDSAFEGLSTRLSGMKNGYTTLRDAIKEYNDSGKLTVDTFDALMNMDYNNLFSILNGGEVEIDKEKVRKEILDYIASVRSVLNEESANYTGADREASKTKTKLLNDFYEYVSSDDFSLDDIFGTGDSSSTENTFDWIEVKINHITEAIEKLREVADDPFASWTDKESALNGILTELEGSKDIYQQAHDAYMEEAAKIGLDQSYIDLITGKNKNGKFEIESFKNDPNYERIQKYQELYEKAEEALKAKAENDKEINSINAELIENQDKQYQLESAKLEAQKQSIQNIIDMNGGQGTADQYNILISYEERILAQKEKQLSNAKEYLGTLAENSDEYLDQLEVVHGLEDETAQIVRNIKDLELEKVNLVLDDIQDNIDDINEKIENQDRFISGAIGILNQEIKVQEGLRDAIQDQIDALQEENDEHERALALEKAKYELQRAQSQRTVKLYSGEDRGFIYTQDREAVRDAQENLDQLEFEATIHALEKQKEYYDDIIADLSEIQDRWSNIASKAQEMLDIQYTLAIGGQGIRDSILGGTYDIDGLANAYQGLLGEQHSYEDLEKLVSDLIAEFEDGTISVEECINQITTVAPQYANLLGTVVNTVLADIEALKGESSKATDSAESDATNATKDITKAIEDETESQTTLLSGFADTVKKTYSEVVSDIIKDMETQFQAFTERLTLQASTLKTTISETLSGIEGNVAKDGVTVNISGSALGVTPNIEQRATGGMLTGEDKKLDKLAHSLGEDHITMLAYKEGERVLTPYQNEVWEDLVQKASNFNFGAPNFDLFTPKHTNVPVSRVANSNQVTIGDIHLHEVQNVPDFAKALQKHLPNISVQYNGKH